MFGFYNYVNTRLRALVKRKYVFFLERLCLTRTRINAISRENKVTFYFLYQLRFEYLHSNIILNICV